MDVFSLAAQITLNSRQFEDALGSTQGSLGKLAKSVISTQTIIKGLEFTIQQVSKALTAGLDAYSDYEQLVGGVDTLFKSSSMKVQQYAKEAYKTSGLSANQYMQTVTSFSATLLQGLKGDTDQAADLANIAIIDMSDNANKLGTDMQTIQNAYTGFAKSNFTMLDNLKLGYGGTKTEMVRLINDSGVLDHKIKSVEEVDFATMIKAIHAIQQEMGITGTTAEEAASTIQGSRASLFSAFQNLLTLAVDASDEKAIEESQNAFVESFATYFNDNLAPTIIRGLNGTDDVIEALVKAILTIDDESLTKILDGVLNAGTGVVTGLTKLTGWVFDKIGAVFSNPKITDEDSAEFGKAVGDFIGTFVREGIEHLPETISGLFRLGMNLANGLIQGLLAGLFGTGKDTVTGEIEAVDDEMQKAIDEANSKDIKANALITWLEDLQTQYGEAAANMPEWQQAMEGLIALEGDYAHFFDSETKQLVTSTAAMRDHTKAMKEMSITEAREKALKEKQQIVTDLEAEKATLQGTIEFEKYNQEAIVDAAYDLLGRYLESAGIGAKFRPGMKGEELESAIWSVYKDLGWSDMAREETMRYWTDPTEGALANGFDFEDLTMLSQLVAEQKGGSTELLAEMDLQREKFEESEKAVKSANDRISAIDKDLVTARMSLNYAIVALDKWQRSLSGYDKPQENARNRSRGGTTIMSHATGLDRVPFDGYRAELHRNEAVLTSAEAAEWRRGGSTSIDYDRMANTIAAVLVQSMGHVGFYFDKEKVAAALTDDVSRNIADQVSAWGYV